MAILDDHGERSWVGGVCGYFFFMERISIFTTPKQKIKPPAF
jgi:hypothetical protein